MLVQRISLGLLTLFGLQHSLMARAAFKSRLTRWIPAPLERSTYVLLSSLLLILLFWQWRPVGGLLWQVEDPVGRAALLTVYAFGWGLVVVSSFLINHFDLFGLRQVWLFFNKHEYTAVKFKETVLYRWLRHPLMFGFIIAFWATPDMSQGHLLFAVVTTAYILLAIQIEERTLLAIHGEEHQRYRERVSMIIPMPPKSGTLQPLVESGSRGRFPARPPHHLACESALGGST